MNIEESDFHICDEGLCISVTFGACGNSNVEAISLEADSCDESMISTIEFILKNQSAIKGISAKEIKQYIDKMNSGADTTAELMKIYLFPEEPGNFGLMFRWEGDSEHGIDLYFSGLELRKTGSAEIAFLGEH